jgi:hypothetical protein
MASIRILNSLPASITRSGRFAKVTAPVTAYRTFSSSSLRLDPEPFKEGKDLRTVPAASSTEKAYPNFSLRDKAYVVTGGGRGLGLTIAEAMVQAGAQGDSPLAGHADHFSKLIQSIIQCIALID